MKKTEEGNLKEFCLNCSGNCESSQLLGGASEERRKGEGYILEEKFEKMDLTCEVKEERIQKLKEQEALIEKELAKLKESLNALISEKGNLVEEK